MFTSRAEFRLYLRIDNADARLTPHGRALGLIDDAAWAAFAAKQARLSALAALLESGRLEADAEFGAKGEIFAQALRRPAVGIEMLAQVLRERMSAEIFMPWITAMGAGALPGWVRNEMKTVETEIKYAGYLEQQRKAMEKMKKAEAQAIPEWFDYLAVGGLSREMQQTLGRVRPMTLGQASRIPGVTPAAVSLIHCFIEIQARKKTA